MCRVRVRTGLRCTGTEAASTSRFLLDPSRQVTSFNREKTLSTTGSTKTHYARIRSLDLLHARVDLRLRLKYEEDQVELVLATKGAYLAFNELMNQ